MKQTTRRTQSPWQLLAALAPLALAPLAHASSTNDEPPAPPSPAQPVPILKATTAAIPADSARAPIASADDLLLALEKADASLRTLQSDLRFIKQFNELEGGDKQTREGRLLFLNEPGASGTATTTSASASKARRVFQIDFTSTTVDNVRHAESQSFIFDGSALTEKNATDKQIIKRRVVAEGQSIDPLAIGEGPFPVPIGQKRERILERFDATLLAPGDSFENNTPPEALAQTYQLRLVPKRGSDEARQYREVRIWYRSSDLLPRMARTNEKDDSSTEVFLTSLRVNEPLPTDAFDTVPPKGWTFEETEFRRTVPGE